MPACISKIGLQLSIIADLSNMPFGTLGYVLTFVSLVMDGFRTYDLFVKSTGQRGGLKPAFSRRENLLWLRLVRGVLEGGAPRSGYWEGLVDWDLW